MERNKRIKIVGKIIDYAKAFHEGRIADCGDIEDEIIKEIEKQVKVEPEVKPANGDTIKIINEFFDDYLLDKDNCFYIDSLKFKNNISFAALILLQAKIDLLSRLSV